MQKKANDVVVDALVYFLTEIICPNFFSEPHCHCSSIPSLLVVLGRSLSSTTETPVASPTIVPDFIFHENRVMLENKASTYLSMSCCTKEFFGFFFLY